MTSVIAIALSGGIDSLVGAALLKDQGHRLIGFHFLTGYEAAADGADGPVSDHEFKAIETYARGSMDSLAHQLDIPIRIIDLRDSFQKQVVEYFVQAYAAGKTPNPCLVCNPLIKFNILFKHAQASGAERMASGHYARSEYQADGRFHLRRGVDPHKDQSYFLGRLSQTQLSRVVFPLGNFTKSQTRKIACERGLIPSCHQESQDVCFIKSGTYGEFIARQPGFVPAPGPIEDIHGRQIGHHKGLHRFTIGQRKGINCPAAEPYYVVRMETSRRCLVVGAKEDLLSARCRVRDINWIGRPPRQPIKVFTRVRYRHKAAASLLSPIDGSSAEIAFDLPQSAVTPGQGAVFYLDDDVLGAGWID